MRRLFYAVVFLLPMCSFAQRQNDVWYFGEGAGISFASGAPTPILGPISTQEGTATVCDPLTGSVLFTTDGRTVYDRNLAPMANGTGLEGGWSSTQSALIIPKPRSPGFYYVFTAGDLSNGLPQTPGLHYNVVDMWQNGGNGDVTVKNVRLLDTCAEKLHATPHCDGESYWVIAHHIRLPRFYMYKVTARGVEAPIISDVGMQYVTDSLDVGGNYGLGMVKFSASGNLVALANPYAKRCEVFDVNLFLGTISNPRLVDTVGAYYGLAFSPNERLLYVTTWDEVFQYSLSPGPIPATSVLLGSIPSADVRAVIFRGGILRGPDGRIYVADGSRLQVIAYPDAPGIGCGYRSDAVTLLAPTRTMVGLPNIIDAQYLPTWPTECKPPTAYFSCDTLGCVPTCLPFVNYSSINSNSWSWQFQGGTPSTFDGEVPPLICFASPGTYTMQLIATNEFGADTFLYPLRIGTLPTISAGSDLAFCTSQQRRLHADGGVSYAWTPTSGVSDPSLSDPVITASETTTFIVAGWSADGCVAYDTVVAEFLEPAPLAVNSVTCNVSDNAVFIIRHPEGSFDSCDVSFRYSNAGLLNPLVEFGEELWRGTLIDGRSFVRMRLRKRPTDDVIGIISGKAMHHPQQVSSIDCVVETAYGCRQVTDANAILEINGCALHLRTIKLAMYTMLNRTIYDVRGRVAHEDVIQFDHVEEQPALPSTTPAGMYIEVLSLNGVMLHRRTFAYGYR